LVFGRLLAQGKTTEKIVDADFDVRYSWSVMNRDSESRLVAFCVEQHGCFNAAAWSQFSDVTPLELAATVRFLAGVTWYGHQKRLDAVAASLSAQDFSALARQTNFDAPRFAGLLQAHLRHAGRLAPA
jgi:hypothetical protein